METKQKDPVKKIKIMLTVEYLIFVAVFAVLGILFLVGVIKVAEWKRYAFTYVTLGGGIWICVDFFWTTFSPARRAKNCLLDKILMFPVGIALLAWDVYAIVMGCAETLPYAYVIGADFCYIAAVYLFQAIYHWFRPIPALIEAALEDEKKKEEAPEVIEQPKEEAIEEKTEEK